VPTAVTARFCPFCGQPIVPGGTFCPSCGASLVGTAAQGGLPGAPSTSLPSGFSPIPQSPPAPLWARELAVDTKKADLEALSDVSLAAIINLVAVVVGLASLIGTPTTQLFTISTSSSGTTATPNQAGLWAFGILVVIGVVLTLLELIYYRSAFSILESYDPRFSTPAKLVLLLLGALPLLLIAALALLGVVYQAVVCAGGQSSIPVGCISAGSLLGIAAALVLLGILVLVGYLGLLVGIWRLGTRYDAVAFKVGAIFLLIPLLNVVGVILVLLSARASRDRIVREESTPSFG
jgi:hypothetical protein